MKYLATCILLISSTAFACWDSHPPFCDTETYASITQAVGVGVVAPTIAYQLSLKIWPEKIQDYRFIRMAGVHIATGILAMQFMEYQSYHDQDPAYTNVIIILPVSYIGNMLHDLIKNGLQNILPR